MEDGSGCDGIAGAERCSCNVDIRASKLALHTVDLQVNEIQPVNG